MHYYIHILALQCGQIRRETEKAETNTKKALPRGKPSSDNSEEAMDFTDSPRSQYQDSLSPASSETNISRKHYIDLKLQPKCLFITSTK